MSKDADRKDFGDEDVSKSPGLGKEAKIGVTVIALLAVVLGVVVTLRLTRSDSDDNVASVNGDAGKEKTGHESKADAAGKDGRHKLFGNSTPPTVVSAKATSGKPPKTTVADLDQWKLASDRGDSKRASGSSASLGVSPALIPNPPKPPHAGRHDRYSSDASAMSNSDEGTSSRKASNDVRLVAPAVDASYGSARRSGGRADSSGYASVEPAPTPPAYREDSRYNHSSPSPHRPGTSYDVDSDRSVPAMQVGRYDTDDYRRDSMNHRNYGGESRRSSASSLYNNPPPRRDDGKYEVQPNDSYWTISERLYGTGAYFKALAQHNRGKGAGEDQLQPGELIAAPTVADLEKSYPDICPKSSRREALQSQSQSRTSTVSTRQQYRGGRTYTVAEGDTLFNIARYELGKASRWVEIYELNRDVLGKDFNYLTPGIQLAMPDGDKSDVIARPPGGTYRR